MTVKPRWIARFAAFAIARCRDLPGSIDRTTDRTRDREPAMGLVGTLVAHNIALIWRSSEGVWLTGTLCTAQLSWVRESPLHRILTATLPWP